MIKQDLSHLPSPAKTTGDGLAPDPAPRFAHLLVEQWREDEQRKGDLARAHTDSRFRHSDAGNCARAIAYAALDIPASDPMDLSGYWNTGLGSRVHDMWQAALTERYPNAAIEQKVRTVGADGSGHIDAVVRIPEGTWVDAPPSDLHPSGVGEWVPKVVAVELKTVGGFAFKMAVGERGAAQGPKSDHLLQAALNAAAVDADEAVVVYLAKEALSVNVAKRKGFDEIGRFAAEWTLTREQYLPLAQAEAERVSGILELLDDGTLPLRRFPSAELPKGHEIQDPATGRWEVRGADGDVLDTGTFWACGYCRWQTTCGHVGPGRVPVEQVVEISRKQVA